MLIQVLSTLSVVIAFIFIYRKYRTDHEDFLLLKLISYYLLCSFRFNFNDLALPAGFIIYLAFLKPQINKPVKKAIAHLGLFVFIWGVLTPIIQNSYFERQRVVNASSNNIYTIDLNEDHNTIKQKLGISEYTKIENFAASFEDSGEIKELKYSFLTNDNKGIVLYKINFSSNKNKYIIKPMKVSEWMHYDDGLINEDQFFYALSYLDLEKAKPQEEYPYYTVKYDGGCANWGVKDFENFLITDNGFNKLNNDELPVNGYVFWIFGNKRTGESSYYSNSNRAYILPIHK
ncbi:hypothetical protein [Desnuesiella massiliensis]|uniref:hypothetical protein n=1 Tax=Desnuesiella massiliensis TaxID=1650662 RepID=UPI0006E2010A|nr:hypothetical protein [Desnuesiella massiliensis]